MFYFSSQNAILCLLKIWNIITHLAFYCILWSVWDLDSHGPYELLLCYYKKIFLHLCSAEKKMSAYGSVMTWEWANNKKSQKNWMNYSFKFMYMYKRGPGVCGMQLIKIAHIWRALLMCQLVEAVCPIKSTGNHQHYGIVCVCVLVSQLLDQKMYSILFQHCFLVKN